MNNYTFKEYQDAARRTQTNDNMAVVWAALGACGECGEMADLVKKMAFYKKDVWPPDVIEEVGDVLWYLNWVCNCLGYSLEDAARFNSAKIQDRFPNGWDAEIACRDVRPDEAN